MNVNERNTEQIVENWLKNFVKDEIEVIRQPSLQGMSKNSKNNLGRPDYVVKFNNHSEILIVIECKSLIEKHEQAIKEVNHYAKFYENQYDKILKIAISGQNEKKCLVTCIIKGEEKEINFEKNLPRFEEIKKHLLKYQKRNMNEFKKEAKKWNKILHKWQVTETDRLNLVSAIVLALQNETFSNKLEAHNPKNNQVLIDDILSNANQTLNSNSINEKSKKIIIETLKGINKESIKKQEKLKDFLIEVKNIIIPYFIEKNFDILGELYNEFIKYARGDQKTGLVLTPFHIAEFMAEIIDVDKESVVFDPCCGTGTFLVAAMKRMISDTSDIQRIKKIKNHQIRGIELREDMFSAAAINMMMNEDGKSNLIHGDCFEESILKQLNNDNFLLSHAILNPPYIKNEIDNQLDFIENALEQLRTKGKCIAIVQSSVGTTLSKKIVAKKKKLLNKHSLIACFKMPNQLFYPVGVETIVLMFEAHKKHSGKTYFGNYVDDGYKVLKHKGRMEVKEFKEICKKWVNNFKEKKKEAGFSLLQKVDHKMEWHPGAYLETDYSLLESQENSQYVKELAIELFRLNLIEDLKIDSFEESNKKNARNK